MAQSPDIATLMGVSMSRLMETVLPFRSSKYLEDFCEKMLGEGIAAPKDLLLVSKEALETKLSTHAAFNFIEMADAISLRGAIDRNGKEASKSGGCHSPQGRRARSRSPNNRGRDRNQSGGGRGRRNNSRPHRGNQDSRLPPSNNDNRVRKPKPDLWAAVEKNDVAEVQHLLALGKDPEEKFEGWSPLMKAAEEGAAEVMRMLLGKNVDLEVSNKKGRTALSFAAAPSNKGAVRGPTPVATLRLLLESGAKTQHKDVTGVTAKERAVREKRDDAIAIFEEFGS
jgi:hypothetical protein